METINKTIQAYFEGVEPVDEVIKKYFIKLRDQYEMDPENTIAAASVCPDELNQKTLKVIQNHFGDYFNLGGLSGFPFTGITGLRAFFDHVPDNGDAFVFFAPHMAVSEEGVGIIQRQGQSRKTFTCGSVLTAYSAINEADGAPEFSSGDYQQMKVYKMLHLAKGNIPEENPYSALMDIICKKSHEALIENIQMLKDQFSIRNVYLIGGFIINTPDSMPDYLKINYFETY